MSLRDRFLIVASKIGSERHLVAVRDSFATILPIIIAGSLAVVLNNLHNIFGMKESFLPMFIRTLNGNVWWGTFAMMTLFIVPLIAYNLAKSYEGNPILTAMVALACYVAILPQVATVTLGEGDAAMSGGAWGLISWSRFSASSLFVGMIISMISAEIFIRLSKIKQLVIKMPEGVPPAVARSFAALVPGVVTLYAVTFFVYIFELVINKAIKPEVALTVFDIIDKFVALPIQGVADSLPAALLVAFMNHFLWIFGLHGSNILEGIIQPIFGPLLALNIENYKNGLEITNIVNKQFFDTYIYLGGSGTTLGLLIAIWMSSKNKAKRTIANLGIGPGIFNINEPVLFGLPIVLNPVFAIPFIITPMILTVISYFALYFNIAGRIIAMAPWSTPPILSAILTTNKPVQSAILQIVNLAISVAIYLPFVAISDKAEIREEEIIEKKKIA